MMMFILAWAFSASVAAFVPPWMPILRSSCSTLASLMTTPNRFIGSYSPVIAERRAVNASMSEELWNAPISTESWVIVFESSAPSSPPSPIALTIDIIVAVVSLRSVRARPTAFPYSSTHSFIPSVRLPKTCSNLA